MAFNWLSKITSFFSGPMNVGIDISDFSVEVLSLNSGRKITIHDREILPDGIVVEGEIKNPAYLAEIIKLIIAKNKMLRGRRLSASFVFPKIKTFISHFEYDDSSPAEDVDEMVRKEVSNFFPDSLDNVIWDFAPVGNEDKSLTKRKILYAVASKSVVDGYIETAKYLGLRSFSIEIEPLLLRRALMPQSPKDSSYLVVDIGANATSFYIFTPGETIEYTSNTKTGGKMITQAVSEGMKISIEEAEKLKTTKGLLDPDIKHIVTDTISPIKDAISYLIDKHERTSGEKLNKIILAGGGSLLPNLDLYFRDIFSKEVVIGNPLLGLKESDYSFSASVPAILFANVIGSGLKNIHKTSLPKSIDFAPLEYREKRSKNTYFLISLIFLIIFLAFALNLFFKPKIAPTETIPNETVLPVTTPTETVPTETVPPVTP